MRVISRGVPHDKLIRHSLDHDKHKCLQSTVQRQPIRELVYILQNNTVPFIAARCDA